MQVADFVFVYVCVDFCEDNKRKDVKLSEMVMYPLPWRAKCKL